MLVTPRPGTDRDNLLKTLQSVHTEVFNLRGGGGPGTAHQRLLAYLEWAGRAVRMLKNQITDADIDHLVLTKRYELLLSGVGTMTSTEREVQRVVNDLVSLELDQRVAAFDDTIRALDRQIKRWSGYAHYVVPDTSFYIEHEDKLENVDFGPLIDVWESTVTVLVPIVIVDELDGLKQKNSKQLVRWRAGYTLAVLDRVFADSTGPARLRAGDVVPGPDGLTRSEVRIELVFDPPGHLRLPINDDEIIDRALTIQALADRKVTLLTYDTGQSMRARSAGLQVIKPNKELGEEPAS